MRWPAYATSEPPSPTGSGAAEGLYILSDDLLVQALEALAALDPDAEGEDWQRNRYLHTRNALRLASTCNMLRAATMLNYCPKTGPLSNELWARALTDVQPAAHLRHTAHPYLAQIALEKRSSEQLRALTVLDGQLGFHCSGACCSHARQAANRKLAAMHDVGEKISAVGKPWVRELSAARDHADVAFVYNGARRLVRIAGKTGWRELSHSPKHKPVLLRASPNGAHVAWTAHSHDGVYFLWLWTPQDQGAPELQPFQVVPAVGELLYNQPTAVWWTSDNRLRVAWTTTFVTPMGTDQMMGQTPGEEDGYNFTTYDVDAATGEVTLGEVWYSDYGGCERLLSVSPDESGTRVACLVRALPDEPDATHYKVVTHSGDMREELSHPHVWRSPTTRLGFVDVAQGYGWGPSAVGMSPSGDLVVAVHRCDLMVLVEIFALDSGAHYGRINMVDVSKWMPLRNHDPNQGSRAVKLRYAVGFSGCGRYATITDQRARWKYEFTGYAVVVLDLVECRDSSVLARIQTHSLCYCEEIDPIFGLSSRVAAPTPLRELHWGRQSVWVLANKGALTVSS